jgi:hypothetical protein
MSIVARHHELNAITVRMKEDICERAARMTGCFWLRSWRSAAVGAEWIEPEFSAFGCSARYAFRAEVALVTLRQVVKLSRH